MAQDYHIYIHSESGNGGGNKTTPFSAKSSSDQPFANKITGAIRSADSVMSGGVNIAQTGVSTLRKFTPWVATAVALVHVVDHVLSVGFAHQEEYTGDYTNNVNYNNFKTKISNIVNPIGYFKRLAHDQAQFKKNEIARDQQKQLLGSSILQDLGV